MPRFAILEHDWPTLHWDILLESGPALRTWAASAPPGHDSPAVVTVAVAEAVKEARGLEGIDSLSLVYALPDHRLAYLDYEGPVSNQRGRVVRFDSGAFAIRLWNDFQVVAALRGDRLRGVLTLVRLDRPRHSRGHPWGLAWSPSDLLPSTAPTPRHPVG